MKTENIVNFLQTQYSDEKLAALLAHTEDGKLSYKSCCCFIGTVTANHSLQGKLDGIAMSGLDWWKNTHLVGARALPNAGLAEWEFHNLASSDTARRKLLLPLIHAEIARRDALREDVNAVRLPDVSGNELCGERTQNTLSSDRQLSHK